MYKLLYEECIKIEVFLGEKFSHRKIAKKLGRSNKTISDEIRKYSTTGTYNAKIAWQKRKSKRAIINTLNIRVKSGSKLEKFILEKIKQYWSPEQIAGRRKIETGESISKDTIYKLIYHHYPEYVKKYFRRKGKKYKKRGENKVKIWNRKSIHDRPKEVEERKKLGHREGDTIQGKNHKQGIVTHVERASGFLLAGKMERRTAANVVYSSYELFNKLPTEKRKTLTLDNGLEFAEHYIIEQICGLTTYFADKYKSQQRGTNENTNGLLRQFYPRGMDLSKIDQYELDKIVKMINNRPRKRLNYLTPIEFLFNKNCVLLE